jgi:adenylate cyclase
MENVERRLSAIVCADVAGYSRLMGADEAGTLASLKDHRRAVDPIIAAGGGRIVKTTGDGLLLEFASVVDAVRASLDAQQAMAQRNVGLPENGRMLFRIGIHMGDIIIDDSDIFGDGINVAARLQNIAEPGGICISQSVYEAIRNKIDVTFVDGGAQELKNIAEPVRVWNWCIDGSSKRTMPSGLRAPKPLNKPSIAVLPFRNMSGDTDQEYFCEGISEDIITELSRFRELFVIARNSSFTYRGKAVDVRQVASELGVRYVLEGSVRRIGNRARITAQLIDAQSGSHIWAQRYDCSLDDVFGVQDEVTRSIIAVLPGRLEAAALEFAKRKGSSSLEAYDYLLRGKYLHHLYTPEANLEAEVCFDRAIEKDPSFALAIGWKACTLGQAWTHEFRPRRPELLQECVRLVAQAFTLDNNDAECHRMLCRIALMEGQYVKSEHHLQVALGLTPNDPRLIVQRGINLTFLGEPEAALPWIEQAMRVDPFSADRYYLDLARALFTAERPAEAIAVIEGQTPTRYEHHIWLAACHAAVGNREQADRARNAALAVRPKLTIASFLPSQPWKRPEDETRLREALEKAGFPE